MKCYIATAFANKSGFHEMRELLEKNGHEITVDWTVHSADGLEGEEREAFLSQCAAEDFLGVYEAEALVFLPEPNMGGAYVELGLALGLFKRVVVVNPHRDGIRDCIFYHLPVVPGVIEVVKTKEEVITFLSKNEDGQVPSNN